MEDKLSKLSEAVVELARMEESLLVIFKRPNQMDVGFKRFHARVDEIAKQALIRGPNIISLCLTIKIIPSQIIYLKTLIENFNL